MLFWGRSVPVDAPGPDRPLLPAGSGWGNQLCPGARLAPPAYYRFLHLFHSKGLDLDKLTACWVKLCLTLFTPVAAGSRLICLADGIKAARRQELAPAIREQLETGIHHGPFVSGHLSAGPRCLRTCGRRTTDSRIHEGLVFCNRDPQSLLDKLAGLTFSIANLLDAGGNICNNRYGGDRCRSAC